MLDLGCASAALQPAGDCSVRCGSNAGGGCIARCRRLAGRGLQLGAAACELTVVDVRVGIAAKRVGVCFAWWSSARRQSLAPFVETHVLCKFRRNFFAYRGDPNIYYWMRLQLGAVKNSILLCAQLPAELLLRRPPCQLQCCAGSQMGVRLEFLSQRQLSPPEFFLHNGNGPQDETNAPECHAY